MMDTWAKTAADRDWCAQAACRGANTLFFKDGLESSTAVDHRVTRAKALCERCQVRPRCAAYAFKIGEPYGIWGGFTENERLLLRTIWRRHANAPGTWVDVSRLNVLLSEIKAAATSSERSRPTSDHERPLPADARW
jgi:WhiB family redox-sensing transcriptional regulator